MNVEYTGRQDVVITDAMRALTEPFLDRMEKMLGQGSSAHVILTAEKHRQIAEVTVTSGAQDLVGVCESTTSAEAALRQALEKTEAQAIRFKEKRATQHRLPKDEKTVLEPALERGGRNKRTSLLNMPDSPLDEALGLQPDRAPGAPSPAAAQQNDHAKAHEEMSTESHITRVIDAVSLRPMSLEEAVKELETSNREVFVFRDRAGLLRILHCRRDGTLERIELPE